MTGKQGSVVLLYLLNNTRVPYTRTIPVTVFRDHVSLQNENITGGRERRAEDGGRAQNALNISYNPGIARAILFCAQAP